ncbi:MAG: HYR domain-containing protein [Bacteroidota bacterium]
MKKSNLNLTYKFAMLFVFISVQLSAQINVNMANTGVTPGSPFTINTPANCFFNFYDSGGPLGNYNTSANASVTFAPSNPATHRIRASFTSFQLEAGWDAFYIFNSTTVGTNQVPGPENATNSGFPAFNWQTISPGTITSNTGIANVGVNNAEALTFQLLSDASITFAGWTAIVNQVPKVACTLIAPGAITANTGGPGSNACSITVTTPLPTFNPGGCNTSYQLQYRLNGGVPTVVVNPGFANITAPVGANVVTWELIDLCGGAVMSSGTQTITVQDNTPPVVTCPGNITLNLDGGECSKLYSYSVPCADNCGMMMPGTVAHPIDFTTGNAGIMFDIKNIGYTTMSITDFGPSLNVGAWTMQVYYTTVAGTWVGNESNPGAWTLAGTANVVSGGPAAGTSVPGFGISLAPGQSLGIYLTSTFGAPLNYTVGSRQYDDGRLRVSSSPGAGKFYPFGNTVANRSYNGYVNYSTASNTQAIQLSGVPSGGAFPIGTTTNVFKCTDAAGNTAICTFNVTISPFPNPVTSLVCDDLVYLALGPNCSHTVTADDVLEGGPYACYDNYIVEIDKVPPFGNGPWVPAILTGADIGKTYKVRVTDPTNWNKCSGDIKVLDNLEPALVCKDVILPCNYSTSPVYMAPTTVNVKYQPSNLPQTLVDLQTRTYDLPVSLPASAVVNDVDLGVKISGDAFQSNLRIELQSPLGTIVRTWEQLGGCGAAPPVWVRFDDEGAATTACGVLSSGANVQIPFGVGVLSAFDGQNPNGTWKVRISDLDGNGDISTIESVVLYLNASGKFSASLPNGLMPGQVTQTGVNTFVVPAGLIDACSEVTLTFVDQNTPQNCASGLTSIITRRWTAKDASGNTETCIQKVSLLRSTFADVQLPPDYDDIDEPGFECTGGAYPSPLWIQQHGFQGFPQIYGSPSGCSITWEYADQKVSICNGSYDIVRVWTITDPCGDPKLHTAKQLIHVRDKTGPTIDCPANVTVTTDPFACCGTVNLPDVLLSDGCSRINSITAVVSTVDPVTQIITNEYVILGSLSSYPGNNLSIPDTLGVLGNTPCLPVGTHIATYTAVDDCGNTSTCSFMISVRDYSPPYPACDEFTVVSIGIDDPSDCYYPNPNGCEFAGVTWVKALSFDNGSYDNCNGVKFTVRRAPPYNAGINALSTCERDIAILESDSIKFYCDEVGTSQMIILRVYQLDPDGSISLFPDGTPVFNECQVQVSVQDKLKPSCEPPLNVTVSCENFDPSLWVYGKPVVYDNCCLDPTHEYQGQKGLSHSANYNSFDTVCNKGTIFRTFKTYDCHGLTNQCQQRIIVNYSQNYFIKFPDDKIVTVCDGTGIFGEPTIFGEDCELLGVSYEDQVYTVVPDACYKIERTWKIINWCTYNPNAPCINVPNPNPNATTNSPINLPGPVVSKLGTAAPWAPTVSKIQPTDATPTNYSTFWDQNANCYTYKQIIKVIDGQDPVIICPASPVEICDLTTNNSQLWNEIYWWDPVCQVHDLCEGPADINVSATDLCSGSNLNIKYLLFLDLDQDGIMETVVSSSNTQDPNVVRFGNANTQNFLGGTPRAFDERPVPLAQKYRFAMQTTTVGTNVTASVRWNTQQSPGIYTVPELPYGTHKIKWIVEDGCGNETVCEYTIVVKDCKAPTVICQNGLTANVMATGITLFVSDFLNDASDNCTTLDHLKFAIRRSGTGIAGFPVDANNAPTTSVTFDCNDIGTQPVEIWAQDKAGNADFCETYIIVQDNLGNCPNVNGQATVAGLLQTEGQNGLEESDVEMSGQNPVGPTFNYFGMTDQDGSYHFSNAVPMFSNLTVTPTKDDNPLNGVSTYDLVLISKHILGIEPLSTPYKMIAADANMSGSITTFDIVEIRKLILGIYDELPSNTSWRFVDKDFPFPNAANPFQTTFPENKSLADIHADQMGQDFVAIKVGDVNNTAIANSLMSSDERSAGTLLFDVDDREVKAGEVFTATFKAADLVTGYQFTLNYNDLEVMDVIPGSDMKADNFSVQPERNAITTSWYRSTSVNKAEFSVKFRARATGSLSKMLGVSSRVTKAEAYKEDENVNAALNMLDIAFRFNSAEGSTVAGVGFELYQNQPNPFVNKTTIGFHLPEATEATLSIFDERGRLLFRQKNNFVKGYNYVPIEKAMLNATGVLFYTLESGVGSATKKMIQAK